MKVRPRKIGSKLYKLRSCEICARSKKHTDERRFKHFISEYTDVFIAQASCSYDVLTMDKFLRRNTPGPDQFQVISKCLRGPLQFKFKSQIQRVWT